MFWIGVGLVWISAHCQVYMQYGELSNDAVLGAKDFFPIRKLIPPVLVPIDAAVWTESIKRLP